jgi:hypothetical protein
LIVRVFHSSQIMLAIQLEAADNRGQNKG